MKDSHNSEETSRRAAIAQAREAMVNARNISHGAARLFCKLTYYLNTARPLPEVWPGYRDLRDSLGCQNESLAGWVNCLKAAGWIAYEDKGVRHVRRYIIHGEDGKPLWGICSGNPEQASALENQNASALENRSICSGNPEHNPSLGTRLKEPALREGTKGFAPPALGEVIAYAVETGHRNEAEAFHDYYAAKGWAAIADWKAKFRSWCRKAKDFNRQQTGRPGPDRNAGTANEGKASAYTSWSHQPERIEPRLLDSAAGADSSSTLACASPDGIQKQVAELKRQRARYVKDYDPTTGRHEEFIPAGFGDLVASIDAQIRELEGANA